MAAYNVPHNVYPFQLYPNATATGCTLTVLGTAWDSGNRRLFVKTHGGPVGQAMIHVHKVHIPTG
jgi:hypothetical protein